MVKKPVILICILLLLFSMAQLRAVSFHLSILGGLNLAMQRENIYSSSDYYQLPRVGFIVGGGLEVSFLPTPIAAEVDFMYECKGGTYYSKRGSYKDLKYKFDYLTIPILIKWIKRARKKGIYIGLGPSIGVPLSAKYNSVDLTPFFKKNDIGIITTLGIELNNFVMEARFNYGLTDIIGLEGSDSYIKNMTGCLMAGLKINLG